MTTGPWFERNRSTPATLRPRVRAARTAVERSSGVMRIVVAVPPRWMFERNSPSLPWRIIDATTLSPRTRQRMSAPPASLMNSCTRKWARRPRNESIMLAAA